MIWGFIAGFIAGIVGTLMLGKWASERMGKNDERSDRDS